MQCCIFFFILNLWWSTKKIVIRQFCLFSKNNIYMYSIAKTLSISICTISNQLSEPYSLLAALPYSYSSDWWFKWFYVIYTLKVPEKLSLYCVFRLIKIYCVIEYTGILWRKKKSLMMIRGWGCLKDKSDTDICTLVIWWYYLSTWVTNIPNYIRVRVYYI